jgi:hypothetical protein
MREINGLQTRKPLKIYRKVALSNRAKSIARWPSRNQKLGTFKEGGSG